MTTACSRIVSIVLTAAGESLIAMSGGVDSSVAALLTQNRGYDYVGCTMKLFDDGLFFADRIAIFKMHSSEILSCFGYSDKQHKGNEGEGQFHLNRSSIDYHMQNHFVQWLTYEELYNLLSSL